MKKHERRRLNLLHLADVREEGKIARIAERVETSPAYLYQITSEKSRGNVGDELAERIERAYGLPVGWMDLDPRARDLGQLTDVELEVVRWLRSLPPEDREQIAANRAALPRALAASVALVVALQAADPAPQARGAESIAPVRGPAAVNAETKRSLRAEKKPETPVPVERIPTMKRSRMIIATHSAALALSLVACAPIAPRQATPPQPPQYREGFDQGCQSGRSAAGRVGSRFTKDPIRFQSDAMYADGWRDGFNNCKGNAEAVDRMLGPVF